MLEKYLIIALCTSNLHDTSWQNAVNDVSGEEISVEVTSDCTSKSGLPDSVDDWGAGKHVSVFMEVVGW